MYYKEIPPTSEKLYISGWEALNIPYESGELADWHPATYWHSKKKEEIKLYEYNEELGMIGIEFRKIDYPEVKEVFIADFPRALVDILLTLDEDRQKVLYNAKEDFLSLEDTKKFFEYLMLIKDNPKVENYLKHEFTKDYIRGYFEED